MDAILTIIQTYRHKLVLMQPAIMNRHISLFPDMIQRFPLRPDILRIWVKTGGAFEPIDPAAAGGNAPVVTIERLDRRRAPALSLPGNITDQMAGFIIGGIK
jgi:hypothetical protein